MANLSCAHSHIIDDHGTDICTECGLVLGSLCPMVDESPVCSSFTLILHSHHDNLPSGSGGPDMFLYTRIAKNRARDLLASLFYQHGCVLPEHITRDFTHHFTHHFTRYFASPTTTPPPPPPHPIDNPRFLMDIYDVLLNQFHCPKGPRKSHFISPITVLRRIFPQLHTELQLQTHLQRHYERAQTFAVTLWRHRRDILDSVSAGERQKTRQNYSDWDLIFYIFFRSIGDDERNPLAHWLFWRALPTPRIRFAQEVVRVAMGRM